MIRLPAITLAMHFSLELQVQMVTYPKNMSKST